LRQTGERREHIVDVRQGVRRAGLKAGTGEDERRLEMLVQVLFAHQAVPAAHRQTLGEQRKADGRVLPAGDARKAASSHQHRAAG